MEWASMLGTGLLWSGEHDAGGIDHLRGGKHEC
jgi:hypothetical protein